MYDMACEAQDEVSVEGLAVRLKSIAARLSKAGISEEEIREHVAIRLVVHFILHLTGHGPKWPTHLWDECAGLAACPLKPEPKGAM